MRLMGLYAIYPKPRLSQSYPEHRKWFVYLVVIMDWFSRYILSWELSITLEKEFCHV
jgi:putative transposase